MLEQLYGFLIALAVGVIVALTGYFLNLNATKQERKERAKEQSRSAVHNILSELNVNLEITRTPFQGRLIPFVTSMFDTYKGELVRLPDELQRSIYQAYVEASMGNAIVEVDLHKVSYGRGYMDTAYRAKCKEITEKVENAINLLNGWLKDNID